MLSYDRLSRKPLLFKSFTGLTMQEFDDIYNKKIAKRYHSYELKRLSKIKDVRERKAGAGRRFNLDVKDRFLMLLFVYYRLYITYTLDGFLFNRDQSNICRYTKDFTKILKMQCLPTIPQKLYKITKRLKTPQEVEQYFPGFLSFIYSTEQQIPRLVYKKRKKEYYSGKKKKHTVKTQFMVSNSDLIIHKADYRKGNQQDYIIYKKNHPVTLKEVVNVFDLGYIGVEKRLSKTNIIATVQKEEKPRGINQEEKEYNKIHSKKRE
ncbi:MAG: transposase family protein [Thermoproteota archaeon]|nr:transposase family protein [Thermoproteota archaeon]